MLAIGDVAVVVRDARASAEWWEQKVGFATHTVGAPGGHAVMVAPPGDRFLLHLCEGFESVEPGNTGIAFVTDDLGAHLAKMQAAGVEFVEVRRDSDAGGMAKFSDPDGNLFWLIEVPAPFLRTEVGRRAPDRRRPASGRRKAASSGRSTMRRR